MNNTKQRLWNLISSGLPADSGIEALRKVVLLNTTIFFGAGCLFLLAAVAFVEGDLLLAAVDSAFILFMIALFVYLRTTGSYQDVGLIGTVACGGFYAFLLAYGGFDKTAYVWSFTYPLITLFLLGAKRGSWMSLSLLVAAIAVFVFGSQVAWLVEYSKDMMIRFIPAYIIIFTFAFAMEKVRETVENRLEASNEELRCALDSVRERTSALSASNQELQMEIADRLRAEEALQESESFLDNVIESIQDGISVLNPDLTIRHTNSVMQRWYAANVPLVGKKCYECYQDRDKPCDPCPTIRSLQSGKKEVDIVPGLGGSPIEWVELYSFPIKDKQSGTITGIVEFVRDITAHRHLEKQLAQAERMDSIGRLAGGIAHDFNNLLMGIRGSASMISSKLQPDHPCDGYLQKIEVCVRNASELTSRLLAFARGGKYEVLVTDLNELIKENLDMFERTKKELTITGDFAADLWPTEVDRSQINQVFLNLFVNAWEAMPAGGDLFLKTENVVLAEEFVKAHDVPGGNYLKVTITDCGTGMDDATQARIFDPFFTTKEKGRGTGLGLASAYGIIKNHNGIVTVKSKPDQGTTFSVYLPATDKPVRQEHVSASEVVKGSETILLVDDEEVIITVGSDLLERLGYRVLVARDGLEALQMYRNSRDKIDCVILDMIMPEVNGGKTYDLLKQADPDIKVLLASGYSIDGQANEILKRGCNGFIQKPFSLEELSEKIRQVLDGGQAAA